MVAKTGEGKEKNLWSYFVQDQYVQWWAVMVKNPVVVGGKRTVTQREWAVMVKNSAGVGRSEIKKPVLCGDPLLELLLKQKHSVCHRSYLSYRLVINKTGTFMVGNIKAA